MLVWEHGKRWIVKESIIDCNWLQPMENSVDPSHLYWLHGDTERFVPSVKTYAEKHEFIRFEYGIRKRRTTLPLATGGEPAVDDHPLLFPTVLRHVAPFNEGSGHRHNLQIRVPVDDHHTQVFRANFLPMDSERSPADAPVPVRFVQLKTGPREYKMNMIPAQDSMAWETQGSRTDRTQEHLGVGDEGVIELRKLLREQIERVQNGLEPIGIIRDPEKNRLIDLGVINERIGLFAAAKTVSFIAKPLRSQSLEAQASPSGIRALSYDNVVRSLSASLYILITGSSHSTAMPGTCSTLSG